MVDTIIDSANKTIKGGATLDFVADFISKVDVLFSQYAADGVLDTYIKEEYDPEIAVGTKDSDYVWSALDGMVHMYNMLTGSHIVFDETVNDAINCSQFTFREE